MPLEAVMLRSDLAMEINLQIPSLSSLGPKIIIRIRMKGAKGIKGRKEVVVAVGIGRVVVAVILKTNSKERGR